MNDSAPGSKLNPLIVPDTPPSDPQNYRRPPSTISQETRASVLARIRELEGTPHVLTPVANLATAGPSSNADLQPVRVRQPRAILALEATLRETRTAARALQAARMARYGGPAHYPLAGAATSGGGGNGGGRGGGGDQNDRGTRFRAKNGWRLPRTRALTHRDLWRGGLGPPDQQPTLPHQKCNICHFAKSHPVSYLCGHSHCYVCIRLWLERKWTCPDCVTPICYAPFRHYAKEAALSSAFPNWNDVSVVDYSFNGLIFPFEAVF
ncbi:hypothetical protein B0H13DRAFT_2313221 [Mycena leptocephala]|nr:hypothetical protein B0H13DRAFT_2313221 [Mycena leptocephala]